MTLKILPQNKQRDMRYRPMVGFTPDGLGDDKAAFDAAKTKREVAIAKWVGNRLERFYPGHAWHVVTRIGFDGRNGNIQIRLNGIMPANMWMNVLLSEALDDPTGKVILRRAGELLERYKLPRGNFDLDHWRQALNAMPIAVKKLGRGYKAPLLV